MVPIFKEYHSRATQVLLQLNAGFVQQTVAKMAYKMAAAYQFALVDTQSTLVIYQPIFSKFHKLIASIKLWFTFKYRFYMMNDNHELLKRQCILLDARMKLTQFFTLSQLLL